MNVPADRKYSETHEWFLVESDDSVVVGITQHAADELTDITYVELPAVGQKVAVGDALGELESVKATSEFFTAVAGEVIAVNEALRDHPERINESALEEGWLVRLKSASMEPLTSLLDAGEYESFVEGGG